MTSIIQNIKKNIKLALPVMLGQLGNIFINLIDNIMVGSLGGISLAAVSLASSIFLIIMVFGWGLASAISPLVAESDAKKDYINSSIILYNGVFISFLLSIIMYIIILIFIPFLSYLGQPEEVIKETIPFLNIISLSLIPWLLFESLRKFSEGLSLPLPGMIITWLGVLINVILNYILIYGRYNFPKLGIIGAAYSTLIARIVMLIGLCIIFYINPKIKKYISYIKYNSLCKNCLKKILNIGTPSGLQMLFEVGAFSIASFISGLSGSKQLAAHQIAVSLASTTYMLGLGFAVTATVRIGNQNALKNYNKLREVGWLIIFMTSIFMLLCGGIFIIFRFQLPLIYINDPDVINISSKLLIVAAFFQLSDGIQSVSISALRGIYDVKIPMWISFFSYWVIAIPLGWIFATKFNMNALGVWVGLGIGLTISSILLIIRYNSKTLELIKNNNIN